MADWLRGPAKTRLVVRQLGPLVSTTIRTIVTTAIVTDSDTATEPTTAVVTAAITAIGAGQSLCTIMAKKSVQHRPSLFQGGS